MTGFLPNNYSGFFDKGNKCYFYTYKNQAL